MRSSSGSGQRPAEGGAVRPTPGAHSWRKRTDIRTHRNENCTVGPRPAIDNLRSISEPRARPQRVIAASVNPMKMSTLAAVSHRLLLDGDSRPSTQAGMEVADV